MKYINWTISIYKICTFSVFVNSCRNAKIFASIYIPFTFNFFNQNRGFKIILVIFLQIHVLLNEICRVGTLIRMFSKISMGSNSILSVSVIFFPLSNSSNNVPVLTASQNYQIFFSWDSSTFFNAPFYY